MVENETFKIVAFILIICLLIFLIIAVLIGNAKTEAVYIQTKLILNNDNEKKLLLKEIRAQVDSRLTDFLAMAKELGEQTGNKAGRSEQTSERREEKKEDARAEERKSDVTPVGEKKIDAKIEEAKNEMRIENAQIKAASVESGTIQVDKIEAKEIKVEKLDKKDTEETEK